MRLLYKDQLKKIKFNLFNFISLSLLVILISLTFTASKQSINRLEGNYYDYLEEQQVEHFQFNMASVDIRVLTGTQTVYLCQEFDREFEFDCYYYLSVGTPAAYNLLNHLVNSKIDANPEQFVDIIDNYVDQVMSEYDIIVEKKNFSDVVDGDYQYRFTNITTTIDLPYVIDGELPDEDFEIAIFPTFAEYNNIDLLDKIIINDVEYTVTAFCYSPDYVFPIYYMNTMNSKTETLVLTTFNTVELLDNYINRKYIGRGELSDIVDAKTYKEMNEVDTSVLGKTTQIKSIKPAYANFAISTLPIEVKNANIFINTFIIIFFSFLGLLLTIFLRRYINKNKDDIETLRSLGYTNFELTKALMVFPFIISLMTFVGFGIGLIISNPLFTSYADRYLFPKADFQIYYEVLQNAILLPILFINLISFIFIRLALRPDKKKSPKYRFKLFKFTPIKTVLSSLLLLTTISVMIIFGLNGNSMFSAFSEETKLGNNYNEMLFLDYFTDEPLDEKHESFTKVSGKISSINGDEPTNRYGVRIYGIEPDNSLKLLIENEIENNLLLNDGVIISAYVQYNLDIKIGDEIVLTIEEQEHPYKVVGVSNELIENNVFVKKSDLNSIFTLSDEHYNGVYTSDDTYESIMISSRVNYDQGLTDMLNILKASSIIVNFILILSVTISLFVFVLVLINYLSDNRLNISILKSIGYNNMEINKKYLFMIYILFIISFIIAIPLTKLVFDLLLQALISNLGYILIIRISTFYIVIAFILLNVIFGITTYFITKYYESITISEILKQNIK